MDDIGKEAMISEVEQFNNRLSQRGVPKFIREFSKQHSPQERQLLAAEIKAKRKEYFDRKDEVISKLENLEDVEDKIVEAVELKAGFESLSSETQGMLKGFYSEQAEKWSQSDYSKEDIQRYFTEEHLSQLNTDEFILLMRRFPNQMVTHVTRQGIRDHFGHGAHTGGLVEYHDGFMRIAADGRLQSVIGHWMTTNEKEKAIANYLGAHRIKSKQDAINLFNNMFRYESRENPGAYPDRTAVHFAVEEVADTFYGAEKGNEIFFAIPSAHIASQYYFAGTIDQESGQASTNDVWIWANEEKGVSINAGLTFIPEDALVNPKTGSKYETDQDGKVVINQNNIDHVKRFVSDPQLESLSNQIQEISGKLHIGYSLALEYQEITPDSEDWAEFRKLDQFKEKLREEFGIENERLIYSLLDYQNLSKLRFGSFRDDPDRLIRNMLLSSNLYLKYASETISSREFWENYFASHPGQKPTKIIYYRGGDPTAALNEFRKNNGITRRGEEENLGFSERLVPRRSDVGMRGADRAMSVILETLDKIYPEAA